MLVDVLEAEEAQFHRYRIEIYMNLGVFYLEAGELDKAEPLLKQCRTIIKNRKSEKGRRTILIGKYNLGLCYERSKSWEKAGYTYENVIKKDHLFIEGYLRLAYVEWRLGNQEQCKHVLMSAIKYCQDLSWKNKVSIAGAYFSLMEGKLDDAWKYYNLI